MHELSSVIKTCREQWEHAKDQVRLHRKNAHANADIWDMLFHWQNLNTEKLIKVLTGNYRLSPMRVRGFGEEQHLQWSAWDAVVLKFLALRLQSVFPCHPRCGHVKGHGGIFRSVREVGEVLRNNRAEYVFRTDIKGFYENIRKSAACKLADTYIEEPYFRTLYKQYIHYSIESAGEFYTPPQGICRGCALSPLTAASILWHVDDYFSWKSPADLIYMRYMDDFLLLSARRWPLKHAVAYLNAQFEIDGYRKHPDKTTIGRIAHGFDWLGVYFSRDAPVIAPRALLNHSERREALIRRCRRQKHTDAQITEKVNHYERRWNRWASSLLEQA